MNNIKKNISEDIQKELELIRNQVDINLSGNMKIKDKKELLASIVPKEILSRSEVLFDTLVNYLIDSSIEILENADISTRNKFYDLDFRKKIKQWVEEELNETILNDKNINYSFDPRIVEGIKSGSIPLIFGTVLCLVFALRSNKILTISTGITTILVSSAVAIYKYNNSESVALESIKNDIDQFLNNSEIEIKKWLYQVINLYNQKFIEFCKEHNYEPNRGIR